MKIESKTYYKCKSVIAYDTHIPYTDFFLDSCSALFRLGQDIQVASQNAHAFESKTFHESQSIQQYDNALRSRLQDIQNQSQQRAMAASSGQPIANNLNLNMGNLRNGMQNPNFNPGPFGQQRPMFQNNMPIQHPQSGQMMNATMSNPAMLHNAQLQQGFPQNFQMQRTPADNERISQLQQNLYNNMSPAEREQAKARFPKTELMALESRGMDPAMHFCGRVAISNFMKHKMHQQQQQTEI